MTTIMLRPDLKTSGGEIHDILLNGRYAGNMTLVYRERDRIGGAVQLDRAAMSDADKQEVVSFVQDYIQDLIHAVRAVDCDVIVTNSPYDHIIATSRDEAGRLKEMDDAQAYGVYADDEELEADDAQGESFAPDEYEPMGDEDADNLDRIEMRTPDGRKAAYYELVVVSETRNSIEYHVYDQEMEWLAEAVFRTRGTDCYGEVHFKFLPGEDEIEAVTDLIVSDFDDEEIDSFDISVLHDGNELERIELTHEDLADEASFVEDDDELDEGDFTVTLARDDGDMLTYEIYNQQHGGLPIGTATIDIANRQLSGFIDFRDPFDEEERETVAMLLMRELDKEKEYKSLNLSVMHENVKIDELMYETDPVH
ncbi:hypothetical protein [Paenibacillus sp.]|uniref:hypothetical protein n=1 Tax=Paenibacillus sp. TaxID=58172 RepID=UPI002D4778D3|nr:hypothetical protein [Paenibacillus sp.]HZG57162.1 hypothetical protein [Paenibacillus sp.]